MIKHVNNEKLLKLAGKDETYDEPLDLFFFLQFLPLHTVQLSWICLPQLFCHELSELFCYQTQIKLNL